MPWVKAGEVTPNVNQMGSIQLANVSATTLGYRFNNVSGVAPRQFGYFVHWVSTTFPDTTAIEVHRWSVPCWFPAGQFLVFPSGSAGLVRRIGFYRLFRATTPQPISLYYFTP